MSKGETVVKSVGISFTGLLTILFIGLKLTGHITWSWFWVLAPLWFGIAIAGAIFLISAVVLGIMVITNFR